MKNFFIPQYPFTVVDPLFVKAGKKKFSISGTKSRSVFFIAVAVLIIWFPSLIIAGIIAIIIINKTAFLGNMTLGIKNLHVIALRNEIQQLYVSQKLHDREKKLLVTLYRELDMFHSASAEKALKDFEKQLDNMFNTREESAQIQKEESQKNTPIEKKKNLKTLAEVLKKNFKESLRKANQNKALSGIPIVLCERSLKKLKRDKFSMTLKIGILDSGYGGHYALMDIQSHFPQYEYEVYLDHKHAPYGDKSSQEIYDLSEHGCKELWEKGCTLILIACNTICAETLRQLQDTYTDKKILGCIIPSVEVAVEISQKNIGLIGTQFTVTSGKYKREIEKLSLKHRLFSYATPELVKYIESGEANEKKSVDYLNSYIQKLNQHDIDTLILGCTHYSVFYEYLHNTYPDLKIIDSARAQTIKLGSYLEKHTELAFNNDNA